LDNGAQVGNRQRSTLPLNNDQQQRQHNNNATTQITQLADALVVYVGTVLRSKLYTGAGTLTHHKTYWESKATEQDTTSKAGQQLVACYMTDEARYHNVSCSQRNA
jgi:hypothetical protein